MIVSIALAVVDKDGVRSKEGDIICVRPQGWKWGTEEVKRYLIIEVNLGAAVPDINEARKLEIPLFSNGALEWPSADETQPEILGKRRFKVPFTQLNTAALAKGITVDFERVRDQSDEYQPLEKTTLSSTGLVVSKI